MLKRKNTGLLLLCMILVFAMAGCNSFRAANTPNSCTSISGSSPKAEFEPGMSSESSNSASAPSGSRSNITPNSGTAASGTNTKAAEGKWVRKASMSVPRYDFGTETVNGKIYVIGGKTRVENYLQPKHMTCSPINGKNEVHAHPAVQFADSAIERRNRNWR